VFVDALPVNSSGKVDRLALPRPESGRHVQPADSTPAGALDQLVANIWKEVLNAEFVGIDDNFFDIGGNSLLMARVHARINEVATSSLSIVDMFQFPTVRALAAQLANGGVNVAEVGVAAPETLDAGRARLLGQARRRAESIGDGTGR
jgi:hypothetical protein